MDDNDFALPAFDVLGSTRKGLLDRFLSIFADVRAGEGATALLLALTVFLIFFPYYLVKPVREALILAEEGPYVAAYAAGAQALLLLAVVPAFGLLASRVNRQVLITSVTLFFASHLVFFYLFGMAGAREGVVFYIWLGVFNTLLPAQFWGFANDLYSESQGRRLFPIVGIGAAVGGVTGAWAASTLMRPVGPYGLMLVTAALISLTAALVLVVNARERGRAVGQGRVVADAPLATAGGFQLVFRERYLFLIALFVVLLNVVNTNGETLLRRFVVEFANHAAASSNLKIGVIIGEFYGKFYFWVNLFGVAMQMFLVSRIFQFVGIRGALFVVPLVSMAGYSATAMIPVLGLMRVVKVFENGADYSLQNTARHALFLPTSREAKYKAKAAIDSFFMRGGDVLAAGVVFAASQLALSTSRFAAVNAVLAGVWLAVVILIYREHKRRTQQRPGAA